MLHLAVISGNVDIIQLLCSKGADVWCQDDRDWTCLHLAAKTGDRDVIELLLVQGGRYGIDMKNSDGQTALHLSVKYGHSELATTLLEEGIVISPYPACIIQRISYQYFRS